MGLTLQAPNIAAQTILPKDEVSIGVAVLSLFNFLGASIFVAIGQALLQNKLVKELKPILPDVDPSTLANAGATTFRTTVPEDQLPAVLRAYNESIRSIWYLGLGLACLVFVASWGMEWKSVKQQKTNTKQEEEKIHNDEMSTMPKLASNQS